MNPASSSSTAETRPWTLTAPEVRRMTPAIISRQRAFARTILADYPEAATRFDSKIEILRRPEWLVLLPSPEPEQFLQVIGGMSVDPKTFQIFSATTLGRVHIIQY